MHQPSIVVFRVVPAMAEVFEADTRWVELTARLVKPGLIPDSEDGKKLLHQILDQAPKD